MKALFVDFEGNPTKNKLSALDKMLAAHGMVRIEATVEQPKPKAKPKAEQPKPEPETPEPSDTRLEDNESKPRRQSKSGMPKPFNVDLEECLFLGMIVSDNGHECPVGAIKGPSKAGKYSLGLIQHNEGGFFVKATGRWWREEELIKDRMEPTAENAELLVVTYPHKK